MPAPAADPRPHRTPKVLGGLAALACVACCALPVLITAGVIGVGGGAVVGWLPALAVVLAVLTAGAWWLGQRAAAPAHRRPLVTAGAAARGRGPLKTTSVGRGKGPPYDCRSFRCPVRRHRVRDRRRLAGVAGHPRAQGMDLGRRWRHRPGPVRGGGHLPVRRQLRTNPRRRSPGAWSPTATGPTAGTSSALWFASGWP